MRITRDRNLEEEIIKLIQKNWDNSQRKGIHLSDLLAPRKAYFQKISPKPPTIEEILYFLSGNAIEKEFLAVLKKKHGSVKENSGITYTVDARFPAITEIKSRRRGLPKEGDEERDFDHYINQLNGYLALDGKKVGNLIVIAMAEKVDASNKTKPVLGAYKIKNTKDEMETVLDDIVQIKEILQDALDGDKNSIDSIPECPSWMCGKEIKTMIKQPFCITCNKEFATDYGIEKHKSGKNSLNHEVIGATYEYTFEPLCKYYVECRELFHG